MIAAGEVIDRPASVVRELVDNAIDAGATEIDVAIRGQGLAEIVVFDNGQGMPPADLELCVEHHATSKLIGDRIDGIATLGFRGEALASIGSVASLSVVSRPRDQDVAFEVKVSGGKKEGSVRPCAGGYGTRITVRDLFYNHPARLKFMKSDRVEKAWIFEIVERAALAHPSISFAVSAGGTRKVLQRKPAHSRMTDVLAREIGGDAIFVEQKEADRAVAGIVPLPGSLKPSVSRQIIAVNGRVVSDRAISAVISSVYRSLIGTKDAPSFCLQLSLPPQEVDVNVHPQKSEVRFLHQENVLALIRKAVEKALADAGMRTPDKVFDLARKLSVAGDAQSIDDPKRLPLGRLMGQAGAKWLVSETVDGIVLIDQHAAHERVILERLKSQLSGGGDDMVPVEPPIRKSLSPMQSAQVSTTLERIVDLGFSLRLQGDDLVMTGYPSVLSGCVPSQLLDLLVETALEGVEQGIVGEAMWETLATAACKAAIKAGDALDLDRANLLLREIEATPNASQCNHGRPTMLFLTHDDIAKLFAR
jgi:DNA mismatch repair protein MutL